MSRFPARAASLAGIRGTIYNAAAGRTLPAEVFPFHVGDTYMEPAEGCRMEDLRVADHPGMHRYTAPQGLARLVDQIVERTRARTGVATERADVLVTAGATGGLSAVAGALLDPGDEVLVMAPHWPLIDGIVRSFHGEPRPVPLLADSDGVASWDAARARLAAALTSKTVALYFGSPNNPTGRVLPPGCRARVWGHLPARKPISLRKLARAGSTSAAALPLTAAKRRATASYQGRPA